MASVVLSAYRLALERLQREGGGAASLERVREMLALLEVATATSSVGTPEEDLDAVLRILTREMQAVRGAIYARSADGDLVLRSSCGLPADAAAALPPHPPLQDLTALGPADEAHAGTGLVLLCAIRRGETDVGVLGLGPREAGRGYGPEEEPFLRCAVACAAAAVERLLLQDELRRVHQKRAAELFQLRNLLDIGRQLAGAVDEAAMHELILTSVMGHFVVSRCALLVLGPGGLVLAGARGLPGAVDTATLATAELGPELERLRQPAPTGELPDGPLRGWLAKARLSLAVPLVAGDRVVGLLGIGERASGKPFSADDRGFAQALARQAQSALENARLQRIRAEKQRQDRELQVARDIQQGLLPSRAPALPGFELAADSRACYEVGGDAYDWIGLAAGRLAVVIADVSGKGTPASLVMASVQASIRALAGTGAPAALTARLNRLVFASTGTRRYVTLFYAELDPSARRLSYVNAGHVPPYLALADGSVSRLSHGGPALGLLEDAAYETGEVALPPGAVLAMVTDGVTEAASRDEVEFGDERVCEVLRAASGQDARAILAAVLAAVDRWSAGAPPADDRTALILSSRPAR